MSHLDRVGSQLIAAIARQFSTSVQAQETKTEQILSGRSIKSTTKTTSNVRPGPRVALLDLSRRDVVNDVILATVNGRESYACALSGPPFKVYWTGITYVLFFMITPIFLIAKTEVARPEHQQSSPMMTG